MSSEWLRSLLVGGAVAVAVVMLLLGRPQPYHDTAPTVSILGTSLSDAVDEHPLEIALGDCRVEKIIGQGYNFGDLLTLSLRNISRNIPISVVELNAYTLNDRRHRNAPMPDTLMQLPYNLYDVAIASRLPLRLRWEAFWQSPAAVLERALWTWPRYLTLHLFREAVRSRLQQRLDAVLRHGFVGGPWPQELEDLQVHYWEMDRLNFGGKDYWVGRDSRVLASIIDVAAAQSRSRARLVLYFPPLNLSIITQVGNASMVARLHQWIWEIRGQCAARGVPCIDLTDLFASRPDLFRDYGHLEEPARPVLTRALARSLRRLMKQP